MKYNITGFKNCMEHIDNALKNIDVENNQSSLNRQIKGIAIGVSTEIKSNFGDIKLKGDEKDCNVIDPKWEGDTLIISAVGKDVIFLEFGAGVDSSVDPDSNPLSAKFGFHSAGWSAGHAGYLVGEKLEKYKGKFPVVIDGDFKGWSYGNRPANAMYRGGKNIKSMISKLKVEVFK